MSIQEYAEKIKAFFGSGRGEDTAIVAAIFLAAAVSFGLGRLSVQASAPEAPREPYVALVESDGLSAPAPAREAGGRIVASKNGTKYYLPSCGGQGRILEENKIFFSSEAEAAAAGYEKSATCKDS